MAQSDAGVNSHAQKPVMISIRANTGQRDPSIKRQTDWAAAGQTSCSKPPTDRPRMCFWTRPHANPFRTGVLGVGSRLAASA